MAEPHAAFSSQQARILIAVSIFTAFQREVVEGIIRFAQVNCPAWELIFHKRIGRTLDQIGVERGYRGAIIESMDRDDPMHAVLKHRGVPAVMVDAAPDCGFPTVATDNDAIGRLAFSHLHSKGLMHFAYVGFDAWLFRERGAGFAQAALAEGRLFCGRQLISYEADAERSPAIRRWLLTLPKPVGLFVGNVELARRLSLVCRRANVLVPEEIAVLAVDNEPIDCALSMPPLSTIDHGMERVGFEAAALLARLLRGDPPPARPILVPPVGVIERQSTEMLAIEDANVRAALKLIRQQAIGGLTVAQLLTMVPVARRTLEIGFRRSLGRSIHAELTRVKLDHARFLLRSTDLPMDKIAQACGYEYSSHLSAVFTNAVGQTPSAYRKQSRGNS